MKRAIAFLLLCASLTFAQKGSDHGASDGSGRGGRSRRQITIMETATGERRAVNTRRLLHGAVIAPWLHRASERACRRAQTGQSAVFCGAERSASPRSLCRARAIHGQLQPETLRLRPNVSHSRPIESQARSELAGYYAMIENLDWNYGRIIQTLEDTGLLADTHIFFFADHGDKHGSHGMFRKTNPYEESIRTPFLISGGPSATWDGRTDSCPRFRTTWILSQQRSVSATSKSRVRWKEPAFHTTESASLPQRRSRIRYIFRT